MKNPKFKKRRILNKLFSVFNPFKFLTITVLLCKYFGLVDLSWDCVIMVMITLLIIDVYRDL